MLKFYLLNLFFGRRNQPYKNTDNLISIIFLNLSNIFLEKKRATEKSLQRLWKKGRRRAIKKEASGRRSKIAARKAERRTARNQGKRRTNSKAIQTILMVKSFVWRIAFHRIFFFFICAV